ncbi:unnamed protein product [Pleuronectes platessa]|uniref:Uncharacterized protein n=1 Tax=Pleuronectes platessa TaxID=8262 RepID=A0A9N7TJ69_PLEPL|nr:unnamed protein product [Pleuronectes platessa]
MRLLIQQEGGALASTSADTRAHYLLGCYGKDVSRIPLPTNSQPRSPGAEERLLRGISSGPGEFDESDVVKWKDNEAADPTSQPEDTSGSWMNDFSALLSNEKWPPPGEMPEPVLAVCSL